MPLSPLLILQASTTFPDAPAIAPSRSLPPLPILQASTTFPDAPALAPSRSRSFQISSASAVYSYSRSGSKLPADAPAPGLSTALPSTAQIQIQASDMNRGVGGPLLCIGDLLSDVADDGAADGAAGDANGSPEIALPSSSLAGLRPSHLQPLRPSRDLYQVFEENYNELIQSLEGTDHSWTALTLKLCTALKTADKLVTCANSNTELLLEKVALLENIIKRGDSAVAMLQSIQNVKMNTGNSSNATNLDPK